MRCADKPADILKSSMFMNIKFLFFTSILIALLFHLFVLNSFTFVFPIKPETPKPKFFFLGPVLKKSDLRPIPSGGQNVEASNRSMADQTILNNMHYETTDPKKNPFIIRAISKPLVAGRSEEQQKEIIKQTFMEPNDDVPEGKTTEQIPSEELNIEPYRPLQFRSP